MKFTVVFKTILNVDEWNVIWGSVSVKMYVTVWWRDTIGHGAGNGGDDISRGVTVCVRVKCCCFLCWCQFELIGRHTDHIQFVAAGTENMYILHLHPHWTCILYLQRTQRAHFLMKYH